MADVEVLDISLSYRHDAGDTCTGFIKVRTTTDGSAPSGVGWRTPFEKISFRAMMSNVARYLQGSLTKTVTVQRTDREGLAPVPLPTELVELLRNDPVAAIRALSPPPQTVNIGRSVPTRVAPVFVAGHDTLSEAIGENVYSRLNANNEVECPGCGYWSVASEPFACRRCSLASGVTYTASWAVFSVADLLALDRPRYYLPRAWNKYGIWITKGDLEQEYINWLKAKEQLQ